MTEIQKNRIQPLSPECKIIIANVLKYMEAEKKMNNFLISPSKAQERVAAATGVSLSTLKRLVVEKKLIDLGQRKSFKKPKEGRLKSKPKTDLSSADKETLRKTIELIKVEGKQYPSLQLILERFKKATGYSGSRESLRIVVHELGICWHRHKRQQKFLETKKVESRKPTTDLAKYNINLVGSDDHTNHATIVKEEPIVNNIDSLMEQDFQHEELMNVKEELLNCDKNNVTLFTKENHEHKIIEQIFYPTEQPSFLVTVDPFLENKPSPSKQL